MSNFRSNINVGLVCFLIMGSAFAAVAAVAYDVHQRKVRDGKTQEVICVSGGVPVYLGETTGAYFTNGILRVTEKTTGDRLELEGDCTVRRLP